MQQREVVAEKSSAVFFPSVELFAPVSVTARVSDSPLETLAAAGVIQEVGITKKGAKVLRQAPKLVRGAPIVGDSNESTVPDPATVRFRLQDLFDPNATETVRNQGVPASDVQSRTYRRPRRVVYVLGNLDDFPFPHITAAAVGVAKESLRHFQHQRASTPALDVLDLSSSPRPSSKKSQKLSMLPGAVEEPSKLSDSTEQNSPSGLESVATGFFYSHEFDRTTGRLPELPEKLQNQQYKEMLEREGYPLADEVVNAMEQFFAARDTVDLNVDMLKSGEVPRALLGRYFHQYLRLSIPSVAADVDGEASSLVLHNAFGFITLQLGVGLEIRRNIMELANSAGRDKGSIVFLNLRRVDPASQRDIVAEKNELFRSKFTHEVVVVDGPSNPSTRPVEAFGRSMKSLEYQQWVRSALDVLCNANVKIGGEGGTECKAAEMVAVLFGGKESECVAELLHFTRRRWPIFVIAESGGYAEFLSGIRFRVAKAVKAPTMDHYRAALGPGDSSTAEILTNGNIFFVEPGTSAGELTAAINIALNGDKTLHYAWQLYATWKQNSLVFNGIGRRMAKAMLLLSLFGTTLSIWLGFMQLVWKDDTSHSGATPVGGIPGSMHDAIKYSYNYLTLIAFLLCQSCWP